MPEIGATRYCDPVLVTETGAQMISDRPDDIIQVGKYPLSRCPISRNPADKGSGGENLIRGSAAPLFDLNETGIGR